MKVINKTSQKTYSIQYFIHGLTANCSGKSRAILLLLAETILSFLKFPVSALDRTIK
jgi:hypothetical protein